MLVPADGFRQAKATSGKGYERQKPSVARAMMTTVMRGNSHGQVPGVLCRVIHLFGWRGALGKGPEAVVWQVRRSVCHAKPRFTPFLGTITQFRIHFMTMGNHLFLRHNL